MLYQVPIRDTVFQLTPPHGGRPNHLLISATRKKFQLTPPHGGRPIIFIHSCTVPRFNSRPRMGGDEPPGLIDHGDQVSTHAPAWGATYQPFFSFLVVSVSTHAPAWGATTRQPSNVFAKAGFNSRPRMGGDRAAPGEMALEPFQLTPPHGGRQITMFGYDKKAVSTHAPAWGATALEEVMGELDVVSTHAPAWGATRMHGMAPATKGVSTHAPAWGATPQFP